MPIDHLRSRYGAFSDRVLASLSEIERRDVLAFDRWFYAGRGWLWLVWIFAANLALATIAAQLPWNMSFLQAALLINAFVFTMLWAVLTVWFGYRKFHGKLLRYVLVTPVLALLGGAMGVTLVNLFKGQEPFAWLFDNAALRHVVIGVLIFACLYATFTAIIAHLRNREYAALTVRLELERRESELSRALAESKLKMLQLQIEPHFLFNTLGSAQQLAQASSPAAARLIGDLIRFLRAATTPMRQDTSTLAEEAAMIRAYLDIMRVRLSGRLDYELALADELGGFRLPPGILITLVENAIKHGIEPYAPGGSIRVSAARLRDEVVISVADTGAGMPEAPGQGIGLANIRERLSLLYADRAQLKLMSNEPRGFVAELRLPAEGLPS
jgi:signal transduction histidine kinase